MRSFIFLFLSIFSHNLLANQCIDLMKKEDFYEASDVCAAMAKKGEMNAQFSLAIMYYQGSGMMSDLGEAQKWMRKAAEQNHDQAQYNLGIMLANGQGSNTDLVSAYAWLSVSAANGYAAATEAVKQLGAELSSKEKKEANIQIQQIKSHFK